MILLRIGSSTILWDWPKRRMAWFFWGWKPQAFAAIGYRIGPLTYWKRRDQS